MKHKEKLSAACRLSSKSQKVFNCACKRKQRVLLGDGWVVEHGHSFDTQQHGQTPRNHVVEDNGAGRVRGGREIEREES